MDSINKLISQLSSSVGRIGRNASLPGGSHKLIILFISISLLDALIHYVKKVLLQPELKVLTETIPLEKIPKDDADTPEVVNLSTLDNEVLDTSKDASMDKKEQVKSSGKKKVKTIDKKEKSKESTAEKEAKIKEEKIALAKEKKQQREKMLQTIEKILHISSEALAEDKVETKRLEKENVGSVDKATSTAVVVLDTLKEIQRPLFVNRKKELLFAGRKTVDPTLIPILKSRAVIEELWKMAADALSKNAKTKRNNGDVKEAIIEYATNRANNNTELRFQELSNINNKSKSLAVANQGKHSKYLTEINWSEVHRELENTKNNISDLNTNEAVELLLTLIDTSLIFSTAANTDITVLKGKPDHEFQQDEKDVLYRNFLARTYLNKHMKD